MSSPGAIKIDQGSPLARRIALASSALDELLSHGPISRAELREHAAGMPHPRPDRQALNVLLHARLSEGAIIERDGLLSPSRGH